MYQLKKFSFIAALNNLYVIIPMQRSIDFKKIFKLHITNLKHCPEIIRPL